MLRTRAPLVLRPVRLACIRPAASVHPEPGSNSPLYTLPSLYAANAQVLGASRLAGRLGLVDLLERRSVSVDPACLQLSLSS